MESSNENSLRNIILNTNKPLIIRNHIKSEIIQWDLNQWKKIINDEILTFRCGKNKYTQTPQWENTCSIKVAKFEEFLNHLNSNVDEWWYFDYKYLREWFLNKTILRDKMPWSELGFPEVTAEESTIWIGSKGAHTPCHIDTYGCNIVLQVYGRKLWLLFPPEENLKPSRIPYEESSIYSKLNFFSPHIPDFKGISSCYKIILSPGDVLIVPHKWWHYVENLDTAISINAWLPLPRDNIEHIKESITAILIGGIANTQESSCRDVILNPNMLMGIIDGNGALGILKNKLKECQLTNKLRKSDGVSGNQDISNLIQTYNFIFDIEKLAHDEFQMFILHQSQRFPGKKEEEAAANIRFKEIVDFIEVISDHDVVSLIARKLIEKK